MERSQIAFISLSRIVQVIGFGGSAEDFCFCEDYRQLSAELLLELVALAVQYSTAIRFKEPQLCDVGKTWKTARLATRRSRVPCPVSCVQLHNVARQLTHLHS
jgi:hypothetical protein